MDETPLGACGPFQPTAAQTLLHDHFSPVVEREDENGPYYCCKDWRGATFANRQETGCSPRSRR